MNYLEIDGAHLELDSFIDVTRNNRPIKLTQEAMDRVDKARNFVDKLIEDNKVVYGLTTGFGKFSDVLIPEKETMALQRNLIVSHSCGVGQPLAEDLVKGVMLLRINALAKGNSGIRKSTIETLIQMVNRGVIPFIPEKGSLGASGDLAPLSHMVLTMMGEGQAFYQGQLMTSKEAMDQADIETVSLVSKEGLALINGTQVMTSIGAHTLYDALELSKTADIATALTMEALNGITTAFDSKVHEVRGHYGQIKTAENILKLVEGSEMVSSQGEIRVQDAYSLRCSPQVQGATKDALEFIKAKVEIEMNAATDNPLIFVDEGEVISGGNFHGQPMALPFDFLAIAIAELANISERRLERLVNPALSEGLPAFLTEEGGLNSGFMIVQYAAAALVSENKVLAHPASVDSIPSSANQEDHVSMGTIAARKARDVLDNSRKVLAMEILGAVQGIDLRGKKELGRGTGPVYELVRKTIPRFEEDRIMHVDIDAAEELIKSGRINRAAEEVLGSI